MLLKRNLINEKELNNVVGGFWPFDITVTIICAVGTLIVGHNRKEPVKEIKEAEFVQIPKQ